MLKGNDLVKIFSNLEFVALKSMPNITALMGYSQKKFNFESSIIYGPLGCCECHKDNFFSDLLKTNSVRVVIGTRNFDGRRVFRSFLTKCDIGFNGDTAFFEVFDFNFQKQSLFALVNGNIVCLD